MDTHPRRRDDDDDVDVDVDDDPWFDCHDPMHDTIVPTTIVMMCVLSNRPEGVVMVVRDCH